MVSLIARKQPYCCDIVINNIFIANAEGRFIDETAISLGISYRF